MSKQTAHVGLWATKDGFNEQITVQLGSGTNWDEPAQIDTLPEDENFYLTQLREFADELVDGDALWDDLDKYEPTLIGRFTINGEGQVLSHSLKI